MKPPTHVPIGGITDETPDPDADCWADGWVASTSWVELRVEIRTPQARVLDVWADEVIVDDWVRPLRVKPGCRPFLAALAGGSMVVRAPDGIDIRLEFGWGMLACDGTQVRISTSHARLHAVADQDEHPPCAAPARSRRGARAMAARTPRRLLSAPSAA